MGRGKTMSDLSPGASPSVRRAANPKPATTNGTSDPMQDLLHALQAMRAGDFSVRMTGDHIGIEGKIADTFNDIVDANERMAQQLEHVGQVVGREGRTRQRVKLRMAGGAWQEMESSVNLLMTVPLEVDVRPLEGEFLRSASIVNTMIKQLSIFTSEVTRVAREVGTD